MFSTGAGTFSIVLACLDFLFRLGLDLVGQRLLRLHNLQSCKKNLCFCAKTLNIDFWIELFSSLWTAKWMRHQESVFSDGERSIRSGLN